jgi:hypothetical protein
MKSSILHLLSLFLVVAFTASCGKKSESKGSSNSSSTFVNPIGSVSGQTAYNNLLAWYNAADNTPVGAHGAYTEKSGSGNFSFSKNICGPGVLNFLCEVPTQCYMRTSNGVMNGVVMMGGSQGLRYDGCNVTVVNQYIKANDAELKEAIQGSASRILMVEKTQQSNGIYTVYFAAYAGSLTPVAAYQINTTLPAILNPVLKQEGSGFSIQEKRVIFAIYQ